jgi:hypothetical protein
MCDYNHFIDNLSGLPLFIFSQNAAAPAQALIRRGSDGAPRPSQRRRWFPSSKHGVRICKELASYQGVYVCLKLAYEYGVRTRKEPASYQGVHLC